MLFTFFFFFAPLFVVLGFRCCLLLFVTVCAPKNRAKVNEHKFVLMHISLMLLLGAYNQQQQDIKDDNNHFSSFEPLPLCYSSFPLEQQSGCC